MTTKPPAKPVERDSSGRKKRIYLATSWRNPHYEPPDQRGCVRAAATSTFRECDDMTTTVFFVPRTVIDAMTEVVGPGSDDDGEPEDHTRAGFYLGAEWFAAGMAVCTFMEDLAALHVEHRGPTTPCAVCGETRGRHCDAPPPPGVVCMECCGEFREVAP